MTVVSGPDSLAFFSLAALPDSRGGQMKLRGRLLIIQRDT
jgi:hypothetical protein